MSDNPPGPAGGAGFVCQRCGRCCRGRGGVWLTDGQRESLARVPGLGPGDLTGAYLERDGRLWAVKVGPDGACAFFEPGLRACRIHGHKPLSCRTWPFYWAPLGSPGAFFEAKDVCPGLSAWDYPDFVAAFAATGAKAPPRSLKKALLGG